jgi:hypothetical protein
MSTTTGRRRDLEQKLDTPAKLRSYVEATYALSGDIIRRADAIPANVNTLNRDGGVTWRRELFDKAHDAMMAMHAADPSLPVLPDWPGHGDASDLDAVLGWCDDAEAALKLEPVIVWDMRPLDGAAYESRLVRTDAKPGHKCAMFKRQEQKRLILSAVQASRRDGQRRQQHSIAWKRFERDGYRPTAGDLAVMRRVLSDGDAERPQWHLVESKLIVAGRSVDMLRSATAPTIIQLLNIEHPAKAADQSTQEPDGTNLQTNPKRSKGRPSDTDHKKDERIFEQWDAGGYPDYKTLAAELNTSSDRVTKRDVELAIARHKKRISRRK